MKESSSNNVKIISHLECVTIKDEPHSWSLHARSWGRVGKLGGACLGDGIMKDNQQYLMLQTNGDKERHQGCLQGKRKEPVGREAECKGRGCYT